MRRKGWYAFKAPIPIKSVFAQHLYERYGISLPHWLEIEEGKEKVWAYGKEVGQRGERRGLIAGRKNKWGYKPTTDFVILFGWMATRNVVSIESREELTAFLKGRPLPAEGEEGLKIVQWRGRGVAMGLLSKGLLYPLFPKHRASYIGEAGGRDGHEER